MLHIYIWDGSEQLFTGKLPGLPCAAPLLWLAVMNYHVPLLLNICASCPTPASSAGAIMCDIRGDFGVLL